MSLGMALHRIPSPRPLPAQIIKKVPATVSLQKGSIALYIYTPKGYLDRKESHKYPVVVNFHGGGFTIGSALDDARFAQIVTEHVRAVFVSVGYRLAPEHPFPTAVEDGVDAMLYLINHGSDIGIDPLNMVVNGFSAGGNLAFSVPLRLHIHFEQLHQQSLRPPFLIRAIMAWYPSLDFTNLRATRKASNPRQDKELPLILSNLFDAAYLYPPGGDMADPLLSPAVASTDLLKTLPDEIIMFPCEWDGLAAEAQRFRRRLTTEAGKMVTYRVIKEARHGFDRAPNPFNSSQKSIQYYNEACKEIRRIFSVSKQNDHCPSPAHDVRV